MNSLSKALVHQQQIEENITQIKVLLPFVIIVSIAFTVFGVWRVIQGDVLLGVLDLVIVSLLIINVTHYIRSRNAPLFNLITLLLVTLIFNILYVTRGIANTGTLWFSSFPIIAFFALGHKKGWYAILFFFLSFVVSYLLASVFDNPLTYSVSYHIQLLLSFLTISYLMYLFERNRQTILDQNRRQKSELQTANARLEKQVQQKETSQDNLLSQNKELEKTKQAMLNLLEDIEEEKEISKQQAADLQKFRLAVENVSDQIVITDPDGKVLYANPALEAITGWKVSEVIGSKAGVLWGQKMTADFYHSLWNRIKVDKKMYQGTIQNKRKNGTQYFAQIAISPILDENDEVSYFVGIERDITKEKEVDRMKTEFISLVSHQLRTPLSAIKWFIEILQDESQNKLHPQQKEIIQNIAESNDRLINMVNSLLNISRIESGRVLVQPAPVRIQTIIQSLLEELQPMLSKYNQQITTNISEDVPEIVADEQLLYEIYKNFITNAIKYNASPGTVTVSVSVENNKIKSSITDHGFGISPEQQDRVFTKFYRADNAVKLDPDGNGLGLYLVKKVIEACQGSVEFVSKVDVGTTFTFYIPMKIEVSTKDPTKNKVALISSKGKINV